MKEKDGNKKFEEITRRKPEAGKESRKERKLMSSTALLFPLLADFNILYRSLAQAVVLFLSHTENAISVFNFPDPSSPLSHKARPGNVPKLLLHEHNWMTAFA